MGIYIYIRSELLYSQHLQLFRQQYSLVEFFLSVRNMSWYTSVVMDFLSGAAFVELYFVMSSLFASRAYYAFGFLALTASVVALTTATVTILFTYFLLCAEEYRWVSMLFLSFNDLRLNIGGIGDHSLSEVVAPSGLWLMEFSTGLHNSNWSP